MTSVQGQHPWVSGVHSQVALGNVCWAVWQQSGPWALPARAQHTCRFLTAEQMLVLHCSGHATAVLDGGKVR